MINIKPLAYANVSGSIIDFFKVNNVKVIERTLYWLYLDVDMYAL